MYTYFTMKPIKEDPDPDPEPEPKPTPEPAPQPDPTPSVKPKDESSKWQNVDFKLEETKVISPNTGDDSHIALWVGMLVLGIGLMAAAAYFFMKRIINNKK